MKKTWTRTMTLGALLVASAGLTFADHDRTWDARSSLATTSHVLELRTEQLVDFTAHFVAPWDLRERRALRDLERLARQSVTFHAIVESPRLDPRDMTFALNGLLDTYDRAAYALERTRLPRAVYIRFDRIGELVEDSQQLTFRLVSFRGSPRILPRPYRAYVVYTDLDGRDGRWDRDDGRDRDDRQARYARPRDDDDRDSDDRRGRGRPIDD